MWWLALLKLIHCVYGDIESNWLYKVINQYDFVQATTMATKTVNAGIHILVNMADASFLLPPIWVSLMLPYHSEKQHRENN